MSDAIALVLASASPRRRELLARLGIPFSCEPAEIDERPLAGESPASHVARVARAKGAAAAARRPGALVLSADTIVVVGGEALGKPRDREDARSMLERLSGRSHEVLTAVAASFRGSEALHVDTSVVTFSAIPRALLEWYLETGEGDDKAGAYAVQGRAALFVARIDGNVQSVVGLPLAALPDLLARVGVGLIARGGALELSPPT